jgi:hypothetical protein
VAIAARAMRQILVDYARQRGAGKRCGDFVRTTLGDKELEDTPAFDANLLALDAALDRAARNTGHAAELEARPVPDGDPAATELTELLAELRGGNRAALDQAVSRLYDELRQVAARRGRDARGAGTGVRKASLESVLDLGVCSSECQVRALKWDERPG